MTKDELEKQVEELQKELQDKKHLGDAVKAKDKEINDLKLQNGVLRENVRALESKKESQLREAVAKSQQDGEVNSDVKYQELKKTFEEEKKKLVEENKFFRTFLERREKELGKLANAHGDLLKTLEASVNTHLTLNAYLINEIQSK